MMREEPDKIKLTTLDQMYEKTMDFSTERIQFIKKCFDGKT